MSDLKHELPEYNEEPIVETDADDNELFAEELEDRFNAKVGSSAATAACAGSSVSTFSSFCSEI